MYLTCPRYGCAAMVVFCSSMVALSGQAESPRPSNKSASLKSPTSWFESETHRLILADSGPATESLLVEQVPMPYWDGDAEVATQWWIEIAELNRDVPRSQPPQPNEFLPTRTGRQTSTTAGPGWQIAQHGVPR